MYTLRYSPRVVKNFLRFSGFLTCIIMLIIVTLQEAPEQPISSQTEERNISAYLKSVEYRGKNSCKSNAVVVIGVISRPTNFQERSAIRSSWGKEISSNWCIFFFIGKQGSDEVQNKLDIERQEEKDVIESSIFDTYENLTLKVGMLFNWVSNNYLSTKYFIKVDDDIFLNIANMKNLIESCIRTNVVATSTESHCQFETILANQYKGLSNKTLNYVAVGYLYENVSPDRNPTSKWYLDKAVYPHALLPKFLSGTCYLMSTNLIPDILNEAIDVPLINLEDVYFTGLIMTSKMNLTLKHNKNWNNFRPWFDDPCYFQTLITAHGLKALELKEMTSKINSLNYSYCNSSLIRKIYMSINKYLSYYIPRI